MTKAYSDEVRREAVELYRSGLTTAQVARQMGISSGTVWNCCKEAGVEKRQPGHHSPYADETKAAAVKLYGEGMSLLQVGAAIDVPPATVRFWCVNAGAIRPNSKRPYPEKTRAQVLQLHSEGWTATRISAVWQKQRAV